MDQKIQPSIKLVRREGEAFLFDVLDAETGRKLTEEEVAARLPEQAEYKSSKKSKGIKTLSLAAKPLRVLGEGDSWINLLLPTFPKTFFNVLGDTFPSRNIGFPGHTFEQILDDKQYVQVLSSGEYRVFVFSGGGNDVLGGGSLEKLLKPKSEGMGSSDPADYVKSDKLKSVLKSLDAGYRLVAKEAKNAEPDILMLVHGYDHAIPRKNGKWLGKPLKAAGFSHDEPLSLKIIAFLVDSFNAMLANIAKDVGHVRHVDVRGTVKALWHDELHPTTTGAKAVAPLFAKEINKLLTS
jgi:lysophospholipase L1-like esterase